MTDGALARAGLTVTGAFLVSRVLGWVRVLVLGNLFGASADLDAYYAAFRIPDLMFQLVAAGAIGSSLIPVLTALIASGERSRAERVASSVANLMLGTLLVLSILMVLFAPVIVPWLVPGFDAETTAMTVEPFTSIKQCQACGRFFYEPRRKAARLCSAACRTKEARARTARYRAEHKEEYRAYQRKLMAKRRSEGTI